MGRGRGGIPLVEKRAFYVELMKTGLSNAEACRRVGVHRKTGVRWQHGRRAKYLDRSYVYAPINAEIAAKKPESGRYLSQRNGSDRSKAGHWEGDLIVGEFNGSAIGTLVERVTRYTMVVHLDGARTAEQVKMAIIGRFNELPVHLRLSLTWDQGIEMARHHEITETTGIPLFFCEPHSPWQRPSNENTNGLLRGYFPKSTDLYQHSPERLAEVEKELNERPRKTLGWDSPQQRFDTLQNQAV